MIVDRTRSDKSLNELDLPMDIVACYQHVGITHLFAWQAECLNKAFANGIDRFE
jgi:hypothetical protein